MAELVVRAYNVGFGDAIHVEVPDRDAAGVETIRHVLVDVGNVLSGPGADDKLFLPVVEDLVRRTGGRLDLYVLSHEHLDHAQGLPFAAARGLALTADHTWLPASAAPGYYETHPQARQKRLAALDHLERIRRLMEAAPRWATPHMTHMLANNDPYRTAACVAFLRGLSAARPAYVSRGMELKAGLHHPFREARVEIWAPEEDSSAYYGRFQPLAPELARRRPVAPAGVDARAFRKLVRSWSEGVGDNMLAIDRAANNSSVVFCLEWRGWRLLFPGDAELRSWRTMDREGVVGPVHFLKVGHHGSHNATPPDEILDRLLPMARPDGRRRVALLSTQYDVYGGVPHDATLDRLRGRCDELVTTETVAGGTAVEARFAG